MTARYGDDPTKSPMTEAIEDAIGADFVVREMLRGHAWKVRRTHGGRKATVYFHDGAWYVVDADDVCRLRRGKGLFDVAECIRGAIGCDS